MVSTSYTIDSNPKLRFGIVTDSHHADIYTKRSRYNRQSLAKMQECVDLIEKQKVKLDIWLLPIPFREKG